ncbi:hypothetical protein GMD78_07230 [Ornithinibacillus sp. L9]|uniref:Uncharacterized protein n=1 Tax=Ornithinibacillus caprae TaxID=2678566 RepID=A0A6N8FIT0_9BACI|nr:hypothetical protein [Ornithinibacillus caprae]MUK88184.1 hypothetical protein [Ornithinibacillus caprae]
MDKCKKCKKTIDNSLHKENRFLPKREYCSECEENIAKLFMEREEEGRESQRGMDRYRSKNTKMYFNKVKRR